MNAVEFVKKFGWDEAKRLLSTQGKTITELRGEFTEKQLKIFRGYIVKDGLMSMVKLKCLVESYELVESCGGIKSAKKEADCLFDNDIEGRAFEIYEAIEDVEKCQ